MVTLYLLVSLLDIGWPHLVLLNYNGELNWESIIDSTNPNAYPDHGLVCDAEGKIYFGDTFGTYFYCFNKNGSLLWKLPLDGYEYDSSPAIGSDGTLYIGTHKSTFFKITSSHLKFMMYLETRLQHWLMSTNP